jgi:FkbM family methyltransferase
MTSYVEIDTIFGRIRSFPEDVITKQLIAYGAHTRPELALLLSMVDPNDDVFDLGGHIGTFAIPLAKKIGPDGRIVVVEALPETFAVLSQNIDHTNVSEWTTLVNAIIGPSQTTYSVHYVKGNNGANFLMTNHGGESIEAPILTLEALCERYFFPRILKIDIEGYEVFALAAAPALVDRHPIIYAEVSEPQLQRVGSTVQEFDHLLRKNGYRLFRNAGDRNGPHDNFVMKELDSLQAGGPFFDVLAVHRHDPRIGRLTSPLPTSDQNPFSKAAGRVRQMR